MARGTVMEQEEPKAPKDLGESADEALETWPVIRQRAPQRRAINRLPPPRFSMKCLLLWIAGAAAAMAAVRRLNPVEPGAIGLLLVSGYAAGCGAAWTGLGLWICKQYITAMGGDIWVESGAGHGAHFQFCLPIVSPPAD